MKIELGSGWHLLRVEIGDHHGWIVVDPRGDRLGNTLKHKSEFDAAMVTEFNRRATS